MARGRLTRKKMKAGRYGKARKNETLIDTHLGMLQLWLRRYRYRYRPCFDVFASLYFCSANTNIFAHRTAHDTGHIDHTDDVHPVSL